MPRRVLGLPSVERNDFLGTRPTPPQLIPPLLSSQRTNYLISFILFFLGMAFKQVQKGSWVFSCNGLTVFLSG